MAESIFLFLLLFLFLSTNPVLSQLNNGFVYNGFKGFINNNNISLNGVAEIHNNGLLQLTNDTLRLIGHAFYPTPIRFKNSTTGKALSFSTAFAFAIVPEYKKLGGHGLAFTISPTKELHGALPSQYLGLLNANNTGNSSNHLFAVEFDTVQDFEFKDINDNHVGIDINGLISNDSVSAGYYVQGNSTMQSINLKSGNMIQGWIDYDSAKNELNVSLSLFSTKPCSSILTFQIDLSPIFEDTMYVGFSASIGLLASCHYIQGWSFNMSGQAQSLNLSSLHSLPGPKQRGHTAYTHKTHTHSLSAVGVEWGRRNTHTTTDTHFPPPSTRPCDGWRTSERLTHTNTHKATPNQSLSLSCHR